MIVSDSSRDTSLSAIVVGGLFALVVFGLITAYGVGSSARAKSNEDARQQASADHSAFCDKFGLARSTSEHAACMGELDALKDRHEAIFNAQNASLL